MKTSAEWLHDLPELPLELFGQGASFDFSKTAPVITNHPHAVTCEPPKVALPRINRASHEIRKRFGWALYPKVICYPLPDRVLLAQMRLERGKARLPATHGELDAVASARDYFRLTDFHGSGSAFCEVRYGPWFATVTETESCDDEIPNMWQLASPGPGVALSWLGTWDDRPQLPNLTVVIDINIIASVTTECCPGHVFCPSSQSCIRSTIACPGITPA